MTHQELATILVRMGCPSEKSLEMAAQLDKRAHQLAALKARGYEDALEHLLRLMSQGWAANQRSSSDLRSLSSDFRPPEEDIR